MLAVNRGQQVCAASERRSRRRRGEGEIQGKWEGKKQQDSFASKRTEKERGIGLVSQGGAVAWCQVQCPPLRSAPPTSSLGTSSLGSVGLLM